MEALYYSAYRPEDIAKDRKKLVKEAIPNILFVSAFVIVGLVARFGG